MPPQTWISLERHLPALFPTPFTVNQAVAYDHLKENVRRWSRTGIRGFVVLGSNGEYPLLDDE